jgi:hypothetical protein
VSDTAASLLREGILTADRSVCITVSGAQADGARTGQSCS